LPLLKPEEKEKVKLKVVADRKRVKTA
jgi:hypothetical protein